MKQNSAYRSYLIYKSAWAFFYALMNTVTSLYFIKKVGMSPFQWGIFSSKSLEALLLTCTAASYRWQSDLSCLAVDFL